MNSLQHQYGVTTPEKSTPFWRIADGHQIGAEGGMTIANNIQHFRELRGWARPELAKRMGTSPQQLERLEKGQRGLKPEWIDKAARALGIQPSDVITPLKGEVVTLSPIEPDLPPVRGVADGDGAVKLKRVNLGFAMGDGTNLDDYVEEGIVEFDPNLLRAITQSPAHRLMIADGVGDSMTPTLNDSDMIMVDMLQNQLNKDDRIWAISLFGAGAIKRLSVVRAGQVEVISDNPAVPNKTVAADDIRIIGRVIWSGRRH
ncbi:MAG: LexA family transcriptional regulator [Sphingobium sp.]